MIREFEFYHGAALARLVHGTSTPISVARYDDEDNAAYILNRSVGLYVKYCGKRLAPWRFSFQQRHQRQIARMRDALGECFVLLICHDDGIVCLSAQELDAILDDVHEQSEWVSISRNKRQMYAVAGSDGRLGFKVGLNDYPTKVLTSMALGNLATDAEAVLI